MVKVRIHAVRKRRRRFREPEIHIIDGCPSRAGVKTVP